MPAIVIRRMIQNDLEDVVTIENEVFSDPWSLNSFRTDLNNDMAYPLVAAIEEQVVGYACIYVVAGEIQIGNIAVAPEFRKYGVAKILMNEILRIAGENNCKSIFLEVRESNMTAQALYISFGFKTIARRDNYYRNPRENAIIMAKEL
jgi:[ribosomal protein S18]-alanine N-acetyltransferase